MIEKMLWWVVWKMPKRLVYLCSVRLMSHGTVGKYSGQIVPDLLCTEALKRWK